MAVTPETYRECGRRDAGHDLRGLLAFVLLSLTACSRSENRRPAYIHVSDGFSAFEEYFDASGATIAAYTRADIDPAGGGYGPAQSCEKLPAHVADCIDFRRRKCGTGVETKERVRGALRAMGFRSNEAERCGVGLDCRAPPAIA
jgi:hypothetical protein